MAELNADLWSTTTLRDRLGRAAQAAAAAGLDALIISPGPDLRYLSGYDAVALERLTALVVPSVGDPQLVVPGLEVPAAKASAAGALGIDIVGWAETDDPYLLVRSMLTDPRRIAVDDRMWAVKALALRAAMPAAEQCAAGPVLRELRMHKSAAEIAALQHAGALIDDVHAQVPDLLCAGRTENQVGRDLASAIAAGHERMDFVTVASGPNGASPHHGTSDRIIERGDIVVIDIGGTTAEGYCSDSTRTYSVDEPTGDFVAQYEVLMAAQQAAVDAVRPGITCQDLDAVARELLTQGDLGELFIHRLGHGIGLETHEDPYLVQGNTLALEPGMAFSIEPGFYVHQTWGARIEDIVVCSDDGVVVCNNQPHALFIVDA